ncbi:unnamed protein product, partial [Gadus morhua 'NCC']
DEDKAPATCPTSQPEADTVDSSEDECKFVSRKEMHQLNLQYNQLRDDYEALKRELYATQEENKHLKEQLKQSKFGDAEAVNRWSPFPSPGQSPIRPSPGVQPQQVTHKME